jgi:arylsulfatase A-like enzyme
MKRRIFADATALGVACGVLIGIGAAAFAVWANADLRYGMHRLAALRMRDSVIHWGLVGIAIAVAIAVIVEFLRPRTFDVDRRWPRIAGAAALLIAVMLWGSVAIDTSRRSPDAPNAILIVVDALRADHLGSYGYPKATTPHLDRLAASSLLFANAYSAAPWTVPSMASLLTSTLPSVHRISEPPDRANPRLAVLPRRFLLLPEVLQNEGYRTGAITTIGWVSPETGYDQGIDEFILADRRDENLVTRAESFISRHADEKFFLYLHFIDLHDYFHPRNLFAVDPLPVDLSPGFLALRRATSFEVYQALEKDLSRPGKLSAADREFLVAAYDRGLAETDRLIGELLEMLKRSNLLERTCVVVTADHGEQFLEHDRLVHGGDALYNEVLHVPFILFAPGHGPGRVITAPVSSLDIAPTLLDAMGVAAPAAFQGRDAVHADTDPRAVIAEGLRSLKLITSEWSYLYGATGGREELYDLRGDPGERTNLATARAETSAALRERLLAAMETSLHHDYVVSRPEVATSRMSRALQERLRALGYLE